MNSEQTFYPKGQESLDPTSENDDEYSSIRPIFFGSKTI